MLSRKLELLLFQLFFRIHSFGPSCFGEGGGWWGLKHFSQYFILPRFLHVIRNWWNWRSPIFFVGLCTAASRESGISSDLASNWDPSPMLSRLSAPSSQGPHATVACLKSRIDLKAFTGDDIFWQFSSFSNCLGQDGGLMMRVGWEKMRWCRWR